MCICCLHFSFTYLSKMQRSECVLQLHKRPHKVDGVHLLAFNSVATRALISAAVRLFVLIDYLRLKKMRVLYLRCFKLIISFAPTNFLRLSQGLSCCKNLQWMPNPPFQRVVWGLTVCIIYSRFTFPIYYAVLYCFIRLCNMCYNTVRIKNIGTPIFLAIMRFTLNRLT